MSGKWDHNRASMLRRWPPTAGRGPVTIGPDSAAVELRARRKTTSRSTAAPCTRCCDSRRSRAISLSDFPWTKCSRFIRSIVSTTSIPWPPASPKAGSQVEPGVEPGAAPAMQCGRAGWSNLLVPSADLTANPVVVVRAPARRARGAAAASGSGHARCIILARECEGGTLCSERLPAASAAMLAAIGRLGAGLIGSRAGSKFAQSTFGKGDAERGGRTYAN
jgi:hypothetical protein